MNKGNSEEFFQQIIVYVYADQRNVNVIMNSVLFKLLPVLVKKTIMLVKEKL